MSAGHGEKVSRKREAAVVALLTCPTLTAAATAVGIDEKTLRKWLKDDAAFRDAYTLARRRLLDDAVLGLQRTAAKAVEALARQLEAEKPGDVIKAAVAILGLAIRGTELLDLAAAVEGLKRDREEGGGRDGEHRNPDAGSPEDAGGPPDAAGGNLAAGAPEGGPGEDHERGGDDPRWLAAEVAPLNL
jgi:hypothetical protein